MSLLDEALASAVRGPQCHTCKWLDGLPEKDRAEVEEAMRDPRPEHAALARAIRARFPDAPTEDSLTRHRKGQCSGTR